MLKNVLLSYCFLIFSLSATAQTWEVGGFVGASGYMGDLNPKDPLAFNNPAFGVLVKKNFNGHFSLKLNYTYGKIEAADSLSDNINYRRRNLSFFTPLHELGLQLEFNFFDFIPDVSKKKYSPYLFAGVGGTFFNPKTKYQGETYDLAYEFTEDQDISYSLLALSIPYGAGVKYNFSKAWSIIGEIGYRTALTDYLDDVSGAYPDFTGIGPGDLRRNLSDRAYQVNPDGSYLLDPGGNRVKYWHAAGTQRGDSRKRDTYMFTGISLTYTFGTSKCPPAF